MMEGLDERAWSRQKDTVGINKIQEWEGSGLSQVMPNVRIIQGGCKVHQLPIGLSFFDLKGSPRVMMYDIINIEMPDPKSGEMKHALFNVYYNMCHTKAAVVVQLCNWILSLPMVSGHCINY